MARTHAAAAQPVTGVPPGHSVIREIPGGVWIAQSGGGGGGAIAIKGVVDTAADLPADGNETGDLWIAADTTHGWAWSGTEFVDVGPLRGPPGVDGEDGEDGAPGLAATLAAGTTTTGAPGSNAVVAQAGTPQARIFNFTVPRGDPGDDGDPGDAATVAIGTTTTGAPGTNAGVTNSGSASAAVFDFTIPRGAPGSAEGDFLELAGGTMEGELILAGDPVVDLEAVTKQYADNIAHDDGRY